MKPRDPIPFVLPTDAPRRPLPELTDDELDDGLDERNLRLLDAVYHHAALIASEDPSPPTPEELAEEAALARRLERLRKV